MPAAAPAPSTGHLDAVLPAVRVVPPVRGRGSGERAWWGRPCDRCACSFGPRVSDSLGARRVEGLERATPSPRGWAVRAARPNARNRPTVGASCPSGLEQALARVAVQLRPVRCGWCGHQFYLCRPCDRSDRYCGEPCRQHGRKRSLRRARLIYARSPKGRLNNRSRQRRHRKRHRKALQSLDLQETVTDHSSQGSHREVRSSHGEKSLQVFGSAATAGRSCVHAPRKIEASVSMPGDAGGLVARCHRCGRTGVVVCGLSARGRFRRRRHGRHVSSRVTRPRPLRPDRLRALERPFGWIPFRILTSGRLQRLGREAKLLYFFLCLVADGYGISFYGNVRLCRLLGLSTPELERGREELCRGDLLAFDGRVYQLLSLPRDVPMRKPPRQRDGEVEPVGRILQRLLQD